MFENIIAQPAAMQLKNDILSGHLAPAMLFFGPVASGKGSTAIELARTLSCEAENTGKNTAAWNCGCSACIQHRSLTHPDLAMIGLRTFSAEIAASRTAFLQDTSSLAGRSLFIRSIRKLQARFAPSVWEYEAKSNRINPLPLLQIIEEELNDFEMQKGKTPEKLSESLLKNIIKLEDEGMGETIPIAQIRMASYWSRLSPTGKRKTLIIENADKMKDEARNSLLKLLEEPPQTISIILTTRRREVILPTILSRLRPYRFIVRSAEEEMEIIRRVFRNSAYTFPEQKNTDNKESTALVANYLETFFPQPPEKLLALAAFFVSSLARASAVFAKSRGFALIPDSLKALGEYCTPIAESAGFDRITDTGQIIAVLVSRSNNFEGRSFPRFLAMSLDLVSWSVQQKIPNPSFISCRDAWNYHLGKAQENFSIWYQRPELILESLTYRLKEEMLRL